MTARFSRTQPRCTQCANYNPHLAASLVPGVLVPCSRSMYWREPGRATLCLSFVDDGGVACLQWHAQHGPMPEGKKL